MLSTINFSLFTTSLLKRKIRNKANFNKWDKSKEITTKSHPLIFGQNTNNNFQPPEIDLNVLAENIATDIDKFQLKPSQVDDNNLPNTLSTENEHNSKELIVEDTIKEELEKLNQELQINEKKRSDIKEDKYSKEEEKFFNENLKFKILYKYADEFSTLIYKQGNKLTKIMYKDFNDKILNLKLKAAVLIKTRFKTEAKDYKRISDEFKRAALIYNNIKQVGELINLSKKNKNEKSTVNNEKLIQDSEGNLNQNYLPKIYETVEYKESKHYIMVSVTMDFIKGNDLYSILLRPLIKEEELISEQEKNQIELRKLLFNDKKRAILEILKAMNQLQKEYNIHSYDIKPHNIMVYISKKNSNLLKFKLIDFDHAYIIGSNEEKELAHVHMTPGYFYARNGFKKLLKKVDEYSIGIVILSICAEENMSSFNCLDSDQNITKEEERYCKDLIDKHTNNMENERRLLYNLLIQNNEMRKSISEAYDVYISQTKLKVS